MHEWSEADDEPMLIGKIISEWIAAEALHRDAQAFCNRVKATLLLKEVLGPSSRCIPNPPRGG